MFLEMTVLTRGGAVGKLLVAGGLALFGCSSSVPTGGGGDTPGPPPVLTGALKVAVDSLPPGVAAEVVITNGSAVIGTLTSSDSLTGLAAGTYAVTASDVVVGSERYAATPAQQTVSVQASATSTARVTYDLIQPDSIVPTYPAMAPGYHAMAETVNGTVYHYQLYIPQGYDPSRSWPVILSWSGSGQMGTDNQAQLTEGLGPYVTNHQGSFNVVGVFPQNPGGSDTPLQRAIFITALDSTEGQVNIDKSREYLTGISQGGVRTWGIAYEELGRFAAFAPIAGDIYPIDIPGDGSGTQSQSYTIAAQILVHLPIWAFHGADDTTVRPAGDRAIYADFLAAGSTVYHYTEYPGKTHDVWDTTYADPNFWSWLLAQHR